MFAHGNHSMMGSTEDPVDGAKVATAVFGAVVVYAVRPDTRRTQIHKESEVVMLIMGTNHRSFSSSAPHKHGYISGRMGEGR